MRNSASIINSVARVSDEMIHKVYVLNQAGVHAQVTFTLPNCIWADKIELAISGNDCFAIKPLNLSSRGDWILTLDLPVDRIYRFSYICDGEQWMNDANADGYECNPRDGKFECFLNTNITPPANKQAVVKTLAGLVPLVVELPR
jgi:hypothetical protein